MLESITFSILVAAAKYWAMQAVLGVLAFAVIGFGLAIAGGTIMMAIEARHWIFRRFNW